MIVNFRTSKLEKECNSSKEAIKRWGDQYAIKVLQRIDILRAAVTLDDITHLPPVRCHELDFNRKGQFAITTKHPARMIFKPDHDPVPLKKDGGIDRSNVTDIIILEVEDYHGKKK